MASLDRQPRQGCDALAGKVEFLSRPDSYPERCARVDRIETHFSWVFLTATHAYKLKKPVHEAFVDLRTVAARRRNCLEELRVNRRFARDVYEAVVPLRVDRHGACALAGPGRAVDWLVRMRRVARERALDQVIARGELECAALVRVVDLVCGVYARSRIRLSADAYRARLGAAIDDNERELSRPDFALPLARIRKLCAEQRALLQRAPGIDERARERRLAEGHGDLRPEHVFLESNPVVIDSLEFSRDLRIVDAADELGFLALECERLGVAWARRCILEAYVRRTGDRPREWIVHFYQSLRACLRARLAIRHLLDPAVVDRARWSASASRYLDLADRHVAAACAGEDVPCR